MLMGFVKKGQIITPKIMCDYEIIVENFRLQGSEILHAFS